MGSAFSDDANLGVATGPADLGVTAGLTDLGVVAGLADMGVAAGLADMGVAASLGVMAILSRGVDVGVALPLKPPSARRGGGGVRVEMVGMLPRLRLTAFEQGLEAPTPPRVPKEAADQERRAQKGGG
jgi:hypothetical protein